jgi:hypothetical protein
LVIAVRADVSPEPGSKELRELTSRGAFDDFQPPPHSPTLADEQGWHLIDREALRQFRALVDVDAIEPKRVVVASPDEDLRECGVDAPAATRAGGVKEN